MDIAEIRSMAIRRGWQEAWHKPENALIRFTRRRADEQIVDVLYTRMTVGTVVSHPVKGRGALFRRNVDVETLDKILINPRVHTRRGYYQK